MGQSTCGCAVKTHVKLSSESWLVICYALMCGREEGMLLLPLYAICHEMMCWMAWFAELESCLCSLTCHHTLVNLFGRHVLYLSKSCSHFVPVFCFCGTLFKLACVQQSLYILHVHVCISVVVLCKTTKLGPLKLNFLCCPHLHIWRMIAWELAIPTVVLVHFNEPCPRSAVECESETS